nr:immunoglobulin heavy chain junction region [Macaca mulatta]MOX92700.1 immunoglobulin heavy chain junction region [Macaca mulatta]MOX93016.1 immunoglobulin heavy chain junction region [Macaca mulatta]MOX93616.1 immunoglobulin heavy chain junction region [Macaca mulatta]MOX93775.1 immunoglobulin heavy chain junction region [Macaca mulatta]
CARHEIGGVTLEHW